MSYGPYKLTSYQADKQYVLEKNEYFYDLSEDTYQATSIVVDCVKEPATRLELFLQGKLDTFGLSKDYMDEYQMSDYCYYATGDSTFAMVFNPDAEALVTAQAAAGENINKTILTIKEFRQAMSYALDRNAFCLATSPMNAPGFGLFSGLIVSDPEAGTAYRTTDVAKNVLAEFWGVSEEYGEGKLYADIDEAIDSITGYNLAKAKELYDVAYDTAIAQGLMDEDDVVEIKIGTPNNTSTFYNNGYEFLVNNYTEAVKGTKLEGKLTFSRDDTLGNAFSDALKNNQVDMLFGVGWTGSALDPYGLIEAYVYTDYQYDDSTDFTAITCDIEINGTVYTASVQDWQKIMNGAACTITAADGSTMEYSCGTADKDPETRLAILGALEGAVLQNYNFLPIMDDASAQLRGQQIEYYTEEYIFGMGFGGMKYYTFNYTDAEWDAYVAENNGELDYT
jgi:ABC-type oligopeptide transport system substrate-binding subunit